MTGSVSIYVPDLMDASKVRAAFPDATVARTAEAILDAELVVVDLARPGVIEAVERMDGRVVGFASHVDEALLARAEAGGIEALPRSVFFRRLADGAL